MTVEAPVDRSARAVYARRSGSDRRHQRSHTDDRDHPLYVVGQNVEAHLGSDLVERPGQEVGGAHPGLEGSEWMLEVCRRTPMASGMRSSRACILSSTSSFSSV